MADIRELTCIGCPMGCALTVEERDGEYFVKGNTCMRGEIYAKNEVSNPKRTVTSGVTVIGGEINKVSVKTATDIPKGKIFECMEEIKKTKVDAPVAIGDVIIKNVCGTGVDIIATKDVEIVHM